MSDSVLPSICEGEDKSSPFVNCIRNNYRHVRKWAKRTHTDCFRIYDRDLHHYPFSIDFYAGRYCIQYFTKSRDDNEVPPELVTEVEHALDTLFNAAGEAIFWRTRFRRKRTEQYEKTANHGEFFTVKEYGVPFRVNLRDYLDTGLFLDHRETRQMAAKNARGKKVLNLFAYTCSFSVHCAVAGACLTKSVDLSNTYCRWGRENFLLNGLPSDTNLIVRADCLQFLRDERRTKERYGLIIIDPPTISRSKKMEGLFDVQADHVTLLHEALLLLEEGGELFFSTNARTFVFDEESFTGWRISDVSAKTIPLDFRDRQIHRCWRLSR